MNCNLAKKCFSGSFDQRLTEDRERALRAHLGDCATCGAEYSRYEQVFAAVRLVPDLGNNAPAPLPETAGAFLGRRRSSIIGGRISVASILLLVCAAGFAGYELGKALPFGESGGSVVRNGGPAEAGLVGLPSRQAGRRLRRLHDGGTNVAWLTNVLGDMPVEQSVQALGHVVADSPLREDARSLLEFDDYSLGQYKNDVHEASHETLELVDDVEGFLRRKEPVEVRLALARDRILKSRLPRYFSRLRPVTMRYAPLPFDPPRAFDVRSGAAVASAEDVRGIASAFICVMTGRERDARTQLEFICRSFPQSPLHNAARVILLDRCGSGVVLHGTTGLGLDSVASGGVRISRRKMGEWESVFRFGSSSSRFKVEIGPGNEQKIIIRGSKTDPLKKSGTKSRPRKKL